MFRLLKIILIAGLSVLIGWGLLKMEIQNHQLLAKINNLKVSVNDIEKENQTFQENIDYFSQPANLMKEAKSLLNYREPGEKMMIIVK